MSANLEDIVAFLDAELDLANIADYPGALNGLQLENAGRVARVVAAVDASLPVVAAVAAMEGPSLLLVHHGMFWQGVQALRGPLFRKLRAAIDADLAIYSAHLPLDVHPRHGNNALLAEALGLRDTEPFLESKGLPLGLTGTWSGSRDELAEALRRAVDGPVHLCPAGPERIERVGLVTGGAGSEVARAQAAGVDAFITGEGPHWSHTLAEELGINLLFGGHYATETFGVRSLVARLGEKFDLPSAFHHHPSGL